MRKVGAGVNKFLQQKWVGYEPTKDRRDFKKTANKKRWQVPRQSLSTKTKTRIVWTHRENANWHNPTQCTRARFEGRRKRQRNIKTSLDRWRKRRRNITWTNRMGAMNMTNDQGQCKAHFRAHRIQMTSVRNGWWLADDGDEDDDNLFRVFS